ncbi:ribosomal protein L37AE/L43A [Pseudomonas corrugata]|nr:ribosomal protein L37AE/L43A [Pseudomonas corrugata]
MPIECQRCRQGSVLAMRIRSTLILLWVCDECEATWKSKDKVNIDQFEDYGALMMTIERSPLWSELEPQ